MKGLAFRYFGKEALKKRAPYLNIFIVRKYAAIENIPFLTVSDVKIYDDLPVDSLTRRCSVRFGDLTKKQRTSLMHIIENHTNLSQDLEDHVFDWPRSQAPKCETESTTTRIAGGMDFPAKGGKNRNTPVFQ
jgi:hypothetical protein